MGNSQLNLATCQISLASLFAASRQYYVLHPWPTSLRTPLAPLLLAASAAKASSVAFCLGKEEGSPKHVSRVLRPSASRPSHTVRTRSSLQPASLLAPLIPVFRRVLSPPPRVRLLLVRANSSSLQRCPDAMATPVVGFNREGCMQLLGQ